MIIKTRDDSHQYLRSHLVRSCSIRKLHFFRAPVSTGNIFMKNNIMRKMSTVLMNVGATGQSTGSQVITH